MKEKRHLSDTGEENIPEGKKQPTVESLKQKIGHTCAQEVIALGGADPCGQQAGAQPPPPGWTGSD